eukprot:2419238-Prymnesium_polylepis.2
MHSDSTAAPPSHGGKLARHRRRADRRAAASAQHERRLDRRGDWCERRGWWHRRRRRRWHVAEGQQLVDVEGTKMAREIQRHISASRGWRAILVIAGALQVATLHVERSDARRHDLRRRTLRRTAGVRVARCIANPDLERRQPMMAAIMAVVYRDR